MFISFHCNRKIILIYKEENSTKKIDGYRFSLQQKNRFCEKKIPFLKQIYEQIFFSFTA